MTALENMPRGCNTPTAKIFKNEERQRPTADSRVPSTKQRSAAGPRPLTWSSSSSSSSARRCLPTSYSLHTVSMFSASMLPWFWNGTQPQGEISVQKAHIHTSASTDPQRSKDRHQEKARDTKERPPPLEQLCSEDVQAREQLPEKGLTVSPG